MVKIIFITVISSILFSCTNEDNGIYFDSSSEFIDLNNFILYSTLESETLKLVNNHRKSINLTELEALNVVSSVAKVHTKYMVEANTINHDNFNNRAQYLIDSAKAKSVGENVAYGYNSAQGVLNGWMNSAEHRKILENSAYTHFGISIEENSESRNYYTLIFIKK